jgi:hypothetical protein
LDDLGFNINLPGKKRPDMTKETARCKIDEGYFRKA